MILAQVQSRVVSSAKSTRIPHRPLLECEPLEGFGKKGENLIAIDTVSAGPGDIVLILQEGTGARETCLEDPNTPLPAQMVIVGVVDQIQKERD